MDGDADRSPRSFRRTLLAVFIAPAALLFVLAFVVQVALGPMAFRNELFAATLGAGLGLALASVAFGILDRPHASRVTALENGRLYREVAEVSRLKEEFLATLSHELRTPLNAIVGWAEILKQEKLASPLAQKAVDTISRNAAAQSQIVSDLLDASRIAKGQLLFNVAPVDLPTVIHAALEAIRPAAEAKGIRVRSILDYRAGLVSGDADRLRQVVWSLLSNAVKFSPKEARVEVSLESGDSEVLIVVADDGPGIPPEFIPHVFERFRQADATSARSHGGLGLGLAIVRHLVDLHGGVVEAANRKDGTGAVFTVRLPRLVSGEADADLLHEQPQGVGADPEDVPTALAGVRVLVVDGDVDTRELLSEILLQGGAEVTTASSGSEGLTALERQRPDVLVADIGLPGEDGYGFLRQVRARSPERGGRTPAVALPADGGRGNRLEALRAGFQVQLSKPVAPAELVTVVASLAAVAERGR